jgi:serine/threonine-protein kinase
VIAGRYAIHDEIASGGMATVHVGRLVGPEGFSRTVAVKRLHPQLAKDPAFSAMLLDEARVASRIRQANVVPILDVHASAGELLLVMEFVHGESLSRLCNEARRRGEDVPLEVASAITIGMLTGLHAAHEATSESGEPLHVVHRDVTPHNVLVGADGVARLIDFGIAKARGRAQVTRDGEIKGKLAYMAPEQLLGKPVDRRTDVYSASVVLWVVLTGRLPFEEDDARVVFQILHDEVPPPSELSPAVPAELDDLVLRGLSRDHEHRFGTAREMAEALERIVPPATAREVAAWVDRIAGRTLRARAERVARIEAETTGPSLAMDDSDTEPAPKAIDVGTAALSSVSTDPVPPAANAPQRRNAAALVAVTAVVAAAAALLVPRGTAPLLVARTGVASTAERAHVAAGTRPSEPAAQPPPTADPAAVEPAASAPAPRAPAAAPRPPRAAPAPPTARPEAAPTSRADPKYGF